MLAGAFEAVAVVGTIVVAFVLVRSARVQGPSPALYLTVAFFSTGWLEPFYDWGLHVSFSDDFHKSSWAWLSLADGGLPIIAPPAYAVYFLCASAVAVTVANRFVRQFGLSRSTALLTAGYVTGFCFDLVVEIFGTQNGLWTFDEVARGVVPFSGTDEQLALGMPLSMGFAIMCATYLLGADDFLPARWARALTGRQNSTGATLAVSILVFHVVNAVTLVPFLLTRAADLTDVPSSGAAVVDPAPPLGTLVFVVWAALATVAVAWFVRRNQRGSRTTRSYPWLSMLGRKRSESTSRV